MATLDLRLRRLFVLIQVTLFSALLMFSSVVPSLAAEIPTPSAAIVLSISGNIENHNRKDAQGGNVVDLDMSMLQALESFSFTTQTPWTDDETLFEGAGLNALLSYVGANSNSFTATALDEYSVNVSGIDFSQYPIIVANLKNDKPMRVRDLGPLWIMFPFDDFPELLNEKNKASAVWQLISIVVQ